MLACIECEMKYIFDDEPHIVDIRTKWYIKFVKEGIIWFEVEVSLQSFIHLLLETISKNIYLR